MNQQPTNFNPLMNMVSIFFVFCILAFGYLLFGDFIKPVFKNEKPLAVSSKPLAKEGDPDDKIVDGIHLGTGMVVAPGFEIVRGNCTACHSAKLVTQNRATREGWEQMIRWMQETQGLWDLGNNEPIILDYLAANYAPEKVGRRANLTVEAIEWYELEVE